MQGVETASSIIRALEHIYQFEDAFDVVVIIRGGGAQLDLASFDHYELAYHVAQFPIPVITGIGHDKDETIVDLVAHTKMKTPTAVAEFLITGAEAFEQKLTEAEVYCSRLLNERMKKENDALQLVVTRLKQGLKHLMKEEEYGFNLFVLRLKNMIPSFLQRHENLFLRHRYRLQLKGSEMIRDQFHLCREKAGDLQVLSRRFMDNREKQMIQITEGTRTRLPERLKVQQSKLEVISEKVRLVDPLQVLKRGYSLTYHEGKLIRSVQDLAEGDQLVTRLNDGEVKSKILRENI
jgi:exodeoxyribonuclease VII large subunit